MEYEERACKICGKPFKPKTRVQIYCGWECQRESNRENARRLMKVYQEKKRAERPKTGKCPACGKEFTKKSGKQLYCGSAECRRARMREYQRQRWGNRNIRPVETKETPKKIKKVGKNATIGEIAAAAREMGLSYGQYVGLYMR